METAVWFLQIKPYLGSMYFVVSTAAAIVVALVGAWVTE